MKHTPGPFETRGCDADGDRIISAHIEGKRRTIAHVYGPVKKGWKSEEVTDANAEFIVTACNSHYDLLAACEAIVRLADENPFNPIGHIVEHLVEVRAAIAAARGEK